jgi:hypothetical protein
MIYFITFINLSTWIYVWYKIRVKDYVKKEMDEGYINGLIDKALKEA